MDVDAYRRETPYTVRQIGRVVSHGPVPNRIAWEDGTTDAVALKQAPPEFATLREGQQFEAVVLRDAVAGRLLEVVSAKPLPILPKPAAALWSSLTTTAQQPAVEWDEI